MESGFNGELGLKLLTKALYTATGVIAIIVFSRYVLGYGFFIATGDSMLPTFSQYNIGIMHYTHDDLNIGDAVAYHSDGWQTHEKSILHRITGKYEDRWVICGDNRSRPYLCERVKPEQIEGKVVLNLNL